MKTLYQIFGSENSTDIDVMFFVEEIPANIPACRALCNDLAQQFQQKKGISENINSNISVVENGRIVAIFKGIVDESNNALFHTYKLHYQDFENNISQVLPRNIDAKLIRTARVLLSFLTKTTERSLVKKALQSNFGEKLAALKTLTLRNYETESALGNTNSLPDFQKTFAFQIGQTLALLEGREYYTKNEVGAHFPDLQPFLNRNKGLSNEVLQEYLGIYIQKGSERLPFMTQLYE